LVCRLNSLSHIQACHYIKQITKCKMLEVVVVVVVVVYKVTVQ